MKTRKVVLLIGAMVLCSCLCLSSIFNFITFANYSANLIAIYDPIWKLEQLLQKDKNGINIDEIIQFMKARDYSCIKGETSNEYTYIGYSCIREINNLQYSVHIVVTVNRQGTYAYQIFSDINQQIEDAQENVIIIFSDMVSIPIENSDPEIVNEWMKQCVRINYFAYGTSFDLLHSGTNYTITHSERGYSFRINRQ